MVIKILLLRPYPGLVCSTIAAVQNMLQNVYDKLKASKKTTVN